MVSHDLSGRQPLAVVRHRNICFGVFDADEAFEDFPEVAPICRGQGARHVLPDSPARELSIGLAPHFCDDSDCFTEQSGACTVQSVSLAGDGKVLTGRTKGVIGIEARRQCLEKCGKLPDEVIACVGGGSNAMGIFAGFISDECVRLTGVEAGGDGLESGRHAASINGGRLGVLHGCKTYLLQTDDGQIIDTHSVSAGLDYPGVGPEHAFLAESKRANYAVINDKEAIEAFDLLARLEGIIPALESSHAVAQAIKKGRTAISKYLPINKKRAMANRMQKSIEASRCQWMFSCVILTTLSHLLLCEKTAKNQKNEKNTKPLDFFTLLCYHIKELNRRRDDYGRYFE